MGTLRSGSVLFCALVAASAASAETSVLDCSKKSLGNAVTNASSNGGTISFTGVCAGPVVVATDGLTLHGVGTAVIDGGGSDAVTIAGASRVSLIDVEVTNGAAGIVVRDGAHVTLSGVSSHGNAGSGIVVHTMSSAALDDVSVNQNGAVGLAGDDGVSITMTSSTITANTARDIQLTFGTRADIRNTVFGTYSCDATVLARGNSGIFCPH